MFLKKIKFIFILLLFYQSTSYSKSNSFIELKSKNISNYFSGIVAFSNNDNTNALDFFNSSKILLNKHDSFFEKYIQSLVLENKVSQAINILKKKNNKNSNFFDIKLLLILDSLKKNDFNKAYSDLVNLENLTIQNKFNSAILETLKQYVFVFKENKILENKKSFGNFLRTFQ